MTGLKRKTEEVPPDERKALLAQFATSGLDYRDFAREHNVNENSFRNWIWLEKEPHPNRKRYSPTERKKTVEAFLASGMTMGIFAQTWGIGTSTLSDWVQRYQEQGSDGLMDRGAGPDDKRRGIKISKKVRSEILEIKRKEPSYGLKKIKQWLRRFRGVNVSPGSIRKTVQAEGLPLAIRPRKKKRSSERVRRFERARAMQLWQSDITQFTMGPSSMRVYLTVFMDDHSRYIVGWRLQSKQTADLVIDSFKDAMVRFGKPEEVLTDQGRQYFAWRGKSELERLLEKEGIKHVVSRAHHPQTLGKCERFWETVANEFWTRAKPQDLEEARIRLKFFIDHYNHQRPHQGLDGLTPADRFFGFAQEVREIIEKTIEENSLRMSLDELPKPPAFLIGQIGDQRIAFHGTSGNFYLSNENLNGDQDGKLTGSRNIVSQFAIERSPGSEKALSKPECAEASALASRELSGDLGARSLGSSDGRRTWTSEDRRGEDLRVMGRSDLEGGSGKDFIDATDSVLANDESSNGGNDGGSFDSATGSSAAPGEWNDRERRNQYTQEESSRT